MNILNPTFIDSIKNIILNARENALRTVDFERVLMYWILVNAFKKRSNKGKIVRIMALF